MILIPPSEGKRSGGSGPPIEASETTKLILKRYERASKHHDQILGVKGDALAHAREANRSVLTAATMPAIERYTGVVYDALDYDTMSDDGKAFCDENVRIISALFGLVAPQDPIPDYKLKIEKLETWKTWKPIISKSVEETYVIDLLPKAHARAVHYDDGVRVEFIAQNGKALGHFGKHIKGRFIRWLCENHVTSTERFAEFREDGFTWNGEAFVGRF